MFDRGYYKDLSEDEISKLIRNEGFDPIKIADPPGRIYSSHSHPETKLLAYLSGNMKVTFAGKTYDCIVGDRVIIPGNETHSAVVGNEGCAFFWSEKLPK